MCLAGTLFFDPSTLNHQHFINILTNWMVLDVISSSVHSIYNNVSGDKIYHYCNSTTLIYISASFSSRCECAALCVDRTIFTQKFLPICSNSVAQKQAPDHMLFFLSILFHDMAVAPCKSHQISWTRGHAPLYSDTP